jgi:RimJ/RimL family protein N-acetyltransferase
MAISAPRIETGRLVLRGHAMDDFPEHARMWADADFVRFLAAGVPLNEEDAWARFLRYPGHWHLLGYGVWAIEEKSTRRFIGNVGFSTRKRAVEQALYSVPEIGWSIAPAAWGKGLGTEAALAALEWADRTFDHERTVCTIRSRNTGSFGIARKCGYTECARIEHKGIATIVLSRARHLGVTAGAHPSP